MFRVKGHARVQQPALWFSLLLNLHHQLCATVVEGERNVVLGHVLHVDHPLRAESTLQLDKHTETAGKSQDNGRSSWIQFEEFCLSLRVRELEDKCGVGGLAPYGLLLAFLHPSPWPSKITESHVGQNSVVFLTL